MSLDSAADGHSSDRSPGTSRRVRSVGRLGAARLGSNAVSPYSRLAASFVRCRARDRAEHEAAGDDRQDGRPRTDEHLACLRHRHRWTQTEAKRSHRRGSRRLVVGGGEDALVDRSDDLFIALDQQHGDPFQRRDLACGGHRQMRRYHRDPTHRHVADVRCFGVMIGERKHTGLPIAPTSPRAPPADSRAVATTRGAPLLTPVPHRESRVFRSRLHLYDGPAVSSPVPR